MAIENPEGQNLSAAVYSINGQLISQFETSEDHLLKLKAGFYIVNIRDARTGTTLLVEKILR